MSSIDYSLPPALTTTRLRFLAQEVHALGPRGIYELFSEIIAGASPTQSIERYGRLSFDYGDFIRALGGDQFPPALFVVGGSDLT